VDVANEIILHAGLSISQVPRAEASQCDSNKECKNYLCQAPSLPYCFDGVCKCGEALKAVALACHTNKECQIFCKQQSGAYCIGGYCSCT
jgi:hypothetical protein